MTPSAQPLNTEDLSHPRSAQPQGENINNTSSTESWSLTPSAQPLNTEDSSHLRSAQPRGENIKNTSSTESWSFPQPQLDGIHTEKSWSLSHSSQLRSTHSPQSQLNTESLTRSQLEGSTENTWSLTQSRSPQGASISSSILSSHSSTIIDHSSLDVHTDTTSSSDTERGNPTTGLLQSLNSMGISPITVNITSPTSQNTEEFIPPFNRVSTRITNDHDVTSLSGYNTPEGHLEHWNLVNFGLSTQESADSYRNTQSDSNIKLIITDRSQNDDYSDDSIPESLSLSSSSKE